MAGKRQNWCHQVAGQQPGNQQRQAEPYAQHPQGKAKLAAHETAVEFIANGFLVWVSQITHDAAIILNGHIDTVFFRGRRTKQHTLAGIEQLQVAVVAAVVFAFFPITGQPVKSLQAAGIVAQKLP